MIHTTINWQVTNGTHAERVTLNVASIEENSIFYELDTATAWILIAGVWLPFPGAVSVPQTQQFKFSGKASGAEFVPLDYYLSDSLDAASGLSSTAQIGYPALIAATGALFSINVLGDTLASTAEVTLRVNNIVVATIPVPPGSSGILPGLGTVVLPVGVSADSAIDVAVTVHDHSGDLILSAAVILF